jgi:endoglycosylceramidase
VILHGFNMVNKLPPYDPAAIGFDARHASFLREHGFNTIRLGLIWKAVEPEPGAYDEGYLDRIAATVDLLGAEGVHVLLDFHQDMLNERYNGQGFPDWAALDDGIRPWPDVGFPGNYVVMRALWRAYDHFWRNDQGPGGVGLQDRYAAAWRHVAGRFRDHAAVCGYDIFNEPFPGSAIARSLRPGGNPDFDQVLSRFTRRVLAAIREVDGERLVFYEPNVVFDYALPTHHERTGDANVGFSFHAYCIAASPGMPGLRGPVQDVICGKQERRVFELADRHATRNDEALLLSEFGASDDVRLVTRVADIADERMVSWQHWAYWNRDPCCERPHEGLVHDLARAPADGNVKEDKLDALARPFPRAVAGTPQRFRFDREARTFELVYSTGAFEAGAESEVFLPPRHFPSGYRVEVGGAAVASDQGDPVLRLRSTAGGDLVALRVLSR